MPEWTKGADCKSAGWRLRWFESVPAHYGKGSIPGEKYTLWFLRVLFLGRLALFPAHIAQSVEHILGKNEVIGSSPIVGSPMFVKMPARGEQELPRYILDPACHGVRINTRRQKPPKRMASYRPT